MTTKTSLQIRVETQQSTDISSVAWTRIDADLGELTVTFRRNKKTYQYDNVPLVVFLDIIKSDSIGRALHASVKTANYSYREITDNGQ